MQTLTTNAVILLSLDELKALIEECVEHALAKQRTAVELAAARTRAYSLEEMAGLVDISTKTAADRCRSGAWPHIQAGTEAKPRYKFAPEHVRQILCL